MKNPFREKQTRTLRVPAADEVHEMMRNQLAARPLVERQLPRFQKAYELMIDIGRDYANAEPRPASEAASKAFEISAGLIQVVGELKTELAKLDAFQEHLKNCKEGHPNGEVVMPFPTNTIQ